MGVTKVKILEEILNDMRREVTWPELLKKYRSKSQLYEALRVFLSESEGKYQDSLDDLNQVQKKLDETNSDLNHKQKSLKQVSLEVDQLETEKQGLKKETGELSQKLCWYKKSIVDLESKGYTEDIVARLIDLEERSGSDLLFQVRTVDDYNVLFSDYEELQEDVLILKNEVETMKFQKKNLEDEIQQLDIVFDELKVRSLSYSNAVDVVEEFIQGGFEVDCFESLRAGLRLVEIKGDPKGTVIRFVNRVLKAKTLYNLKVTIKNKKTLLSQVNEELELIKQKKQIALEEIVNSLEELGDRFKEESVEIRNEGLKALRDQKEEAVKVFREECGQFNEVIKFLQTSLPVNIELNSENARLGESVNCGRAFWSFSNCNEWLFDLSSEVVGKVVERVSLWASENMNKHIMPDLETAAETGLNSFRSYNIVGLLRFLAKKIQDNN